MQITNKPITLGEWDYTSRELLKIAAREFVEQQVGPQHAAELAKELDISVEEVEAYMYMILTLNMMVPKPERLASVEDVRGAVVGLIKEMNI